MAKILFPDTFLWGATSSAYQIEGATQEGGRSPSIWDKFAASEDVIRDGSNGNRTAMHFDHWEIDLDLMKRIRLQSYNFSISWSRILPNAVGSGNDSGLDFYDRLVDELLLRGIKPFVTLNHWDLPLVLEDKGGWLRRDTIFNFADYAQKVSARLGDRVQHWTTHNDPYAIAFDGYEKGILAPGETKTRGGWIAAHHLLLAHAEAADALRAESRIADPKVGIALRLSEAYPSSDSDADHRAAIQWDGAHNRWFLDPLYKGEYPDDIFQKAKSDSGEQGLDWIHRGDLQKIQGSADFLGVNYYSRVLARSEQLLNAKVSEKPNPKFMTDAGFEFAPNALEDLLIRLHKDYKPAEIYISENGAAYTDAIDEHDRYPDVRRMNFLSHHLQAVAVAMQAGVPVLGYFVRSFLDSWEWTDGFTLRYGLVAVDFDTEIRTLRDSAYWYARVIDTKDHDWNAGIDYRDEG